MRTALKTRSRASEESPVPDPARTLRQARTKHRLGLAAGAAGRPTAAAEHFRAGLRLLGPAPAAPEAAALAARCLLSLAHAEAEQGRVEHGLALLDQAWELAADEDRAIVVSQRALLNWRAGHYQRALPLFDQSIQLLADHPDPIVLARVLLNRAGLHMAVARLSPARADLARCESIARAHGAELLADKAVNGLGYCELLAGNIPAALDLLGRAESGYREHGPGNVPIAQVDRSRALLAAGLADEAAQQLESATAAFRAQRLRHDLAEAELALAQALTAAGDVERAADHARRAERNFRANGNEPGATLARLARARADFARCFGTDDGDLATSDTQTPAQMSAAAPGSAPRSTAEAVGLARRLARIADHLGRLGLVRDAASARLLSAIASLRAGASADQVAAGLEAAVPRGMSVPLETRLSMRLARAELARSRGDRATAYAELRKGLGELHAQRLTFGSFDLQTAVTALGRELTRTGLHMALESGRPRTVFAWSERSRAQAMRLHPIRMPQDPDITDAIAQLRHLDQTLRTAELEGREVAADRQRHAALRRALRARTWTVGGESSAGRPAPVGLAEVTAELAASGHHMISLLRHGDRLLALHLTADGAHLTQLGSYRRVAEAAQRLVGDLEARMARRLPQRLQAVIEQSIRHQIDVLTREIFTPLRLPEDGAPIVLIPTGSLAAVPWSQLPQLRSRAVTLCPSAEIWLTARRERVRDRGAGPDPRPVLAAGPQLAHADAEVAAIARLYPDAHILTGQDATVEATLRAMDGARTVHLAAHGHHERGNVLFSRVDLADGPLMAYDLQRLTKAPQTVVLSACDVGRADIRSGDEHLGFTAALLHTGTPTVISSITRVADDTTARLMTGLHQAISTGITPALALVIAGAAMADYDHPFTCFGAG